MKRKILGILLACSLFAATAPTAPAAPGSPTSKPASQGADPQLARKVIDISLKVHQLFAQKQYAQARDQLLQAHPARAPV